MPNHRFEPSYLSLHRSGELAKRAKALEARLEKCDICPRKCGVNRLKGKTSFCRSGFLPIVSSACAHHGEEPALSGSRGSGTIFFGNCNMKCVYCQNYQISQGQQHNEVSIRALAQEMLTLQNQGCHNINFVTPSHFAPQIMLALVEAVPMGLHVPLVYNTSGYDSLETIRALDGVIDIYLPDLRYASDEHARKLSQAPGYVEHARAAIREMYRQVGNLKTDEDGIAERGLIVRHLVLPERIAGSRESITWLARQISPEITVSIMSQYYPAHLACGIPPLSRRITREEYTEVVEIVNELGLENGWLQEMDAPETYQPDFERDGHPFEAADSPPLEKGE